jgi:hypothetical protein
VLKFRSVNNIVIAPASTGKERSNKIVVIKMDHTNRGKLSNEEVRLRMFKIVVIKLVAPKIEEAPAKCKLKMAKSTLAFM